MHAIRRFLISEGKKIRQLEDDLKINQLAGRNKNKNKYFQRNAGSLTFVFPGFQGIVRASWGGEREICAL